MQNLKKYISILLILLSTIFLCTNCEKEPVTYRFTDADKLKLLPHYTEGKIITFANEIGEERKFKVEKIEQIISEQFWIMGGCGGNCHNYFYCESKYIYLIDLETHNKFYLTLARFPLEYNKAAQDKYRLLPSSLLGRCSSGWDFDHYFSFSFNTEETIQTFIFNGITYRDVIIINRGEVQYGWIDNPGMFNDAQIVYYDIYQGLIGFDDINDHQWRLDNRK
ncbi:MAG: hypothetical protein FWD09_09105 [Lentimicrobiaceae bacterium]|nr:hypothetical protein [Lentimicrobiaceae bacterium]